MTEGSKTLKDSLYYGVFWLRSLKKPRMEGPCDPSSVVQPLFETQFRRVFPVCVPHSSYFLLYPPPPLRPGLLDVPEVPIPFETPYPFTLTTRISKISEVFFGNLSLRHYRTLSVVSTFKTTTFSRILDNPTPHSLSLGFRT